MIFGAISIEEAEGALLAHSVEVKGSRLSKGRRLTAEDIHRLRAAGLERITVARLEVGDVHEDTAARRLAEALSGDGLAVSTARTGRCNLVAMARGLVVVDAARFSRLNFVDEALSAACRRPYEVIEAQQMAATLKMIPFAVSSATLDQALTIAADGPPIVHLAAFSSKRVGLIQTTLSGTRDRVLGKTYEVLARRLGALGCDLIFDQHCPHDEQRLAAEIARNADARCDILIISGASATVDRGDVVPIAIELAKGQVDHFGMPVDPGNLLLLGHRGRLPILGMPGCARSPKLNGFDWVLQRLVADLEVTSRDIMEMGIGGLLKEIDSRPMPRAVALES